MLLIRTATVVVLLVLVLVVVLSRGVVVLGRCNQFVWPATSDEGQ